MTPDSTTLYELQKIRRELRILRHTTTSILIIALLFIATYIPKFFFVLLGFILLCLFAILISPQRGLIINSLRRPPPATEPENRE